MKITTLVIAALVVSAPAVAGIGHSHDKDGGHSNHGPGHGPISDEKAAARATKKVNELIKKGKLDKSWKSIKPDSVEQKEFAKGREWVVVFKNDRVTDKSKASLYIFYSLDGHYIAANFTGK